MGEGDAVEGGVELSVAGAAEPVVGALRGGDGEGGGAVVSCVGVGGAEAVDAGGLADDLGGGQRAAAADREQRGRERADAGRDLLFKGSDLKCQLAAALDEFAGEPSDEIVCVCERGCQPLECAESCERSRCGLAGRVELV